MTENLFTIILQIITVAFISICGYVVVQLRNDVKDLQNTLFQKSENEAKNEIKSGIGIVVGCIAIIAIGLCRLFSGNKKSCQ